MLLVKLPFILVAAIVLGIWTIGKSIVGGLIGGTLLRAAVYAENSGVPRDFIDEIIEFPDIVKHARRELASGDRNFAALDVYEQYGKAIVHLNVKAREIEMQRLKKEMERVFTPQCDRLHDYSACYISALYISTLAAVLARMMPTQEELREVFDHCFRHPNLGMAKNRALGLVRNRAWEKMLSLPKSGDDLLAMGELVTREVTAKKFEFFYKLRIKYRDNDEQGISESDLAAADPRWYLKL